MGARWRAIRLGPAPHLCRFHVEMKMSEPFGTLYPPSTSSASARLRGGGQAGVTRRVGACRGRAALQTEERRVHGQPAPEWRGGGDRGQTRAASRSMHAASATAATGDVAAAPLAVPAGAILTRAPAGTGPCPVASQTGQLPLRQAATELPAASRATWPAQAGAPRPRCPSPPPLTGSAPAAAGRGAWPRQSRVCSSAAPGPAPSWACRRPAPCPPAGHNSTRGEV